MISGKTTGKKGAYIVAILEPMNNAPNVLSKAGILKLDMKYKSGGLERWGKLCGYRKLQVWIYIESRKRAEGYVARHIT